MDYLAAGHKPFLELLERRIAHNEKIDLPKGNTTLTLVLTNQKRGEDLVREALGDRAAILPYVLSGFPLARDVIELYEQAPSVEAIVILSHGIFTFGEDGRTSYERMMGYVKRAEAYIAKKIKGKSLTRPRSGLSPPENPDSALARLAQAVRGACAHRDDNGRLKRFIVETRRPQDIAEVSLAEEAESLGTSGVLTPDHVIRTKNVMVHIDSVPDHDRELKELVQRAVGSFTDHYHEYFHGQLKTRGVKRDELDPYPRVFLVAGLGLVSLGFTRKAARIAADIAEHTIRAKLRAEVLAGYVPISDSHVFDMEYWSLQQKKQ